MNFINSTEDLYRMLDRFTQGVDWDCFYTERDKPAPFLKFNKSPDKCVVDFLKEHSIKKACEFGCGEGRNAIYLARHGVAVEAFDSSEVAIENAKRIAKESGAGRAAFVAGNIFALDLTGKKYELVIDSGIFHHLPPHRRLQYRDMVSDILEENGYLILVCFLAGGEGADEVDDYEFYKSKQTGTAFTEEKLRRFWGEKFEMMEIRKGDDIARPEMWESSFMYICLLKKV